MLLVTKLLMTYSAEETSLKVHLLTFDVICIWQSAGECISSLRYGMQRKE